MSPHATGMIAGLLTLLAVLAMSAALRRHERGVGPNRRAWNERLLRHRRPAGAAAVALIVTVVTRIPVLGVVVAVSVWLVPWIIAGSRQRAWQRQTLEATHAWLLQVRTVLAAGTALEQAIVETAQLEPAHSPLAAATERLVVRMGALGPTQALRAFATEADNHVADAAVTVFVDALSERNVGVVDALDGLLEWAEQDVRQQRDIDARLQSVRTQRWMIIGIFGALAVYFTAANPTLMSVYTTALGQLVLAAILAVVALCLWGLERMSRPYRPPRYFAHQEAG